MTRTEQPMAYTIAHLSDPHLSRKYYREHLKSFKILLRTIVDAGIDHIIVSGDIVSTADENDYYLAREIFASMGLLRADRLTVVPGNHDIFGGPHRAIDVLSFPDHIRSVDYHRHLALFEQAFAETFEGVEGGSGDSVFPFLKRVGPFELLGLNSVPPWSIRRNILGTNGLVDEEQLLVFDSFSAKPDEGRHRVAVFHHHLHDLITDDAIQNSFWKSVESKTMRMRKRRRLMRALRGIGVTAALHGHVHRNEIYSWDGLQVANGAGAVCDDPVRRLKYNLLTAEAGALRMKPCILPVPYQVSTVDQPIAARRRPLPARVIPFRLSA